MKLGSRLALAAATLALVACNKEPPAEEKGESPAAAKTPDSAPAAAADPASEATKTYDTRCAMCHGASGQGDGAASAALTVKPRNFGDKEWQTEVKDQEIKDIIVKGGSGVGKDPGMPAGADLESKPELLDALVKKIRSFGE